jgi:hypothetical protein
MKEFWMVKCLFTTPMHLSKFVLALAREEKEELLKIQARNAALNGKAARRIP